MSGVLATACCLLSVIPAHSLPDGHLERGVQVLVFPDRVEIHYRLGLTDRQVLAELQHLGNTETLADDPAAALLRYRQRMADALASQLSLRVDGESRPVSFRDVYREERHHVRFVVVCGADVSVGSKPVKIEVRDETMSGAAAIECRRMALRGRQGVVVTESTGKTALVRVPRKPVVVGDLDSSHPSRRIVAFCRVPGGRLELDGTIGNGSELVSSVGEPSPGAARAGEVASPTDAYAETDSSESDVASNDVARHSTPSTMWLVAGGVVLVVIGVWLATLAKKRSP